MESRSTRGVVPVLRWLSVLPGALVFDVLIRSPLNWTALGTLFLGGFTRTSSGETIPVEQTLASLVGMFGYVFGGAFIAPTRKITVSVVLSLLLIIPNVVLLFKAAGLVGPRSEFAVHLGQELVLNCLGATAAIGVAVFMRKGGCLRASLRGENPQLACTRCADEDAPQPHRPVRPKWWAVLRLILLVIIALVLLWWNIVVALPLVWGTWAGCLR
jgi:hypothetical protein